MLHPSSSPEVEIMFLADSDPLSGSHMHKLIHLFIKHLLNILEFTIASLSASTLMTGLDYKLQTMWLKILKISGCLLWAQDISRLKSRCHLGWIFILRIWQKICFQIVGRIQFLVVPRLKSLLLCWLSARGLLPAPRDYLHFLPPGFLLLQTSNSPSGPCHVSYLWLLPFSYF